MLILRPSDSVPTLLHAVVSFATGAGYTPKTLLFLYSLASPNPEPSTWISAGITHSLPAAHSRSLVKARPFQKSQSDTTEMQEKRLQPQSQTTVQLPRRSTYLGIDEVYCGKVIHIKRCELHVGNHPAIVLAVNRLTKRVRVWQASSFREVGGIDGKYNGKYQNQEVMKRNKSGWVLVDDGGDTRPHDTPNVHLAGGRFERTTSIDTGRVHELHISYFAKESFGDALWDVYLPHDQMDVLRNHATSRGSRLVPSNTYRSFGKINGDWKYNLSHDNDLEGLGGDRESEENEKSE